MYTVLNAVEAQEPHAGHYRKKLTHFTPPPPAGTPVCRGGTGIVITRRRVCVCVRHLQNN